MKLSYVQKGEGKDLVLLHGYLASKECFYPLIDYFSDFYRVTAPDFLGMGGADALTEPFSVDDYADWTHEALTLLGVHDYRLIAHSFGGRVGIKLLARGEADCAVLTGCAGIVPKRTLFYRFRVGLYRTVRKFAPSLAEAKFGSSDYRGLSPVMKESFKKIVREDLREEAARITRPVLFLYGANDRETPPSYGEIFHAAVPHSRLTVLRDCGHFAFLDDPLAFRLAVEDFFHDV